MIVVIVLTIRKATKICIRVTQIEVFVSSGVLLASKNGVGRDVNTMKQPHGKEYFSNRVRRRIENQYSDARNKRTEQNQRNVSHTPRVNSAMAS
jgi:hypothetical protein